MVSFCDLLVIFCVCSSTGCCKSNACRLKSVICHRDTFNIIFPVLLSIRNSILLSCVDIPRSENTGFAWGQTAGRNSSLEILSTVSQFYQRLASFLREKKKDHSNFQGLTESLTNQLHQSVTHFIFCMHDEHCQQDGPKCRHLSKTLPSASTYKDAMPLGAEQKNNYIDA